MSIRLERRNFDNEEPGLVTLIGKQELCTGILLVYGAWKRNICGNWLGALVESK